MRILSIVIAACTLVGGYILCGWAISRGFKIDDAIEARWQDTYAVDNKGNFVYDKDGKIVVERMGWKSRIRNRISSFKAPNWRRKKDRLTHATENA